MPHEQTTGEYRVSTSFNPSGDALVNAIKAKAAELIDLIESIDHVLPAVPPGVVNGERQRLKALANTWVEAGAMWAVKAATKSAPEIINDGA